MKPMTQTAEDTVLQREWSRFKFPNTAIRWSIWFVAFTLIVWSIEFLEIPLDRLFGMLDRMGATLANRYYPPDIEYIMDADYFEYVIETIQMAYLGALFGLLVTLPLGWFAAYKTLPPINEVDIPLPTGRPLFRRAPVNSTFSRLLRSAAFC